MQRELHTVAEKRANPGYNSSRQPTSILKAQKYQLIFSKRTKREAMFSNKEKGFLPLSVISTSLERVASHYVIGLFEKLEKRSHIPASYQQLQILSKSN